MKREVTADNMRLRVEKVGEYFTFNEMITTNVRDLSNMPPDHLLEKVIENLKSLCSHVLDPLRSQHGVVNITSGYRSPNINFRVGGSTNSQHTKGQAADLYLNDVDHLTAAIWIADNTQFDQLILEFCVCDGTEYTYQHCPGWIHVSRKLQSHHNVKQRGEILLAGRDNRSKFRYSKSSYEDLRRRLI